MPEKFLHTLRSSRTSLFQIYTCIFHGLDFSQAPAFHVRLHPIHNGAHESHERNKYSRIYSEC